jgi:hypothetical protein
MNADRKSENGGGSDNGRKPAVAGGGSNWERVEEEYRRIVKALNRSRVSFTARSAEGITLYGGMDSHSANGDMRKLAKVGHRSLLNRIKGHRDPDEPPAIEGELPPRAPAGTGSMRGSEEA